MTVEKHASQKLRPRQIEKDISSSNAKQGDVMSMSWVILTAEGSNVYNVGTRAVKSFEEERRQSSPVPDCSQCHRSIPYTHPLVLGAVTCAPPFTSLHSFSALVHRLEL